MTKSSTREKIIHASLKEVHRLGEDSDFPSPCASIGLVLKRKKFGGADLSIHTPRLSSLISGEILECEDKDIDIRLRQELLNLAENCQELADYLMSEKSRLEKEAEKETLIYESIEMIEDNNSARVVDPAREPHSTSSVSSKKRASISSVPDPEPNLDIFS